MTKSKISPEPPAASASFQSRVDPWLIACFGETIARDREERNHRFLEEALELVQANGCSDSEAHQLVDYVYGRPIGEPAQEVGGVMNTLAALCLASGLDMHEAAETELARVWTKVETIRAKQAAKPKHSPLPESPAASLGELRALSEAATAGEWYRYGRSIQTDYENCSVKLAGTDAGKRAWGAAKYAEANAAFIIASVNYVRALLARTGAL